MQRQNRLPQQSLSPPGPSLNSNSADNIMSPVKVYAPPAYRSPKDEPSPLFSRVPPAKVQNAYSQPEARPTQPQKFYTSDIRPNGMSKDRSPRMVNIRGPASKASSSSLPTRTSTIRSGRESNASMTSFESLDSDGENPDDYDDTKHLTPVAESPISNLRYPTVPRSSNEYRRSPPSHQNNTSRSSPQPSLLVKRRGHEAANSIEKQFWVSDSNIPVSLHTRGSEASGFSNSTRSFNQHRNAAGGDDLVRQVPHRPANLDLEAFRGMRSAEIAEVLGSPMWAPRITPTRRGDDLFLSVSKIYQDGNTGNAGNGR